MRSCRDASSLRKEEIGCYGIAGCSLGKEVHQSVGIYIEIYEQHAVRACSVVKEDLGRMADG